MPFAFKIGFCQMIDRNTMYTDIAVCSLTIDIYTEICRIIDNRRYRNVYSKLNTFEFESRYTLVRIVKRIKMMRFFWVFCLLQMTFLAQSQSVKTKKGEVFIDNELYCLYEETSSNILFSKNITIKSIDNTELFFVRREMVRIKEEDIRLYAVVINLENSDEFEIEEPMSNTLKFLVKNFYANKVIVDNSINEEGLNRFKLKFAGEFKAKYEAEAARARGAMSDVVIVNVGATDDVLVERNRKAAIFITNKKIKQDLVEIGSYTMTSRVSDGKITNEYRIFDVNNRLIAMVEKEKFGTELQYVTMKDNHKHNLRTETNIDEEVIKTVVKELVDFLYI